MHPGPAKDRKVSYLDGRHLGLRIGRRVVTPNEKRPWPPGVSGLHGLGVRAGDRGVRGTAHGNLTDRTAPQNRPQRRPKRAGGANHLVHRAAPLVGSPIHQAKFRVLLFDKWVARVDQAYLWSWRHRVRRHTGRRSGKATGESHSFCDRGDLATAWRRRVSICTSLQVPPRERVRGASKLVS
jgi:hypothetical protein